MTDTINALAVAALVAASAVLTWAVETRARALLARPAEPPAAEFQALPPGARWLVCHDTACGHMTTRHLPQLDGTHRCEYSARHRGAVHLTHTTTQGDQ
ncbi:hypothetical protein [Streptomyces sp. RTd22]|uniref:hypothetical protein n=1 Tax=Streptomyces sp. RTd22 TaxID=1841249 RepID=UPI0007C58E09|nr:hypothetical protein [Streptomyces sp. RTd22]